MSGQKMRTMQFVLADGVYTRNFIWKIDNVLSLQQDNGEYVQSEIFKSKGPYGQDVKWVLRLFPRGEKGFSKNNVAVFLHLLEVAGNGLKDVKVNWKLAIINAKEIVTNKHEEKSCLFDLENDIPGWGFDNFVSRTNLADPNKNFIVDGHKLILHSQISIKAEKNLKAELMQEKEQTKSLKRKLDEKEAEIGKMRLDIETYQNALSDRIANEITVKKAGQLLEKENNNLKLKLDSKEEELDKIRSDYEQYQKRIRIEIENLEKENSDAIKKFQADEEERSTNQSVEYEQLLKRYRENIAKLEKDKLDAVEKCRKEEQERLSNLRSEYEQQLKLQMKRYRENVLNVEKTASEKLKKLQGKYDKLSNFMRDSSKLMEEIENEE